MTSDTGKRDDGGAALIPATMKVAVSDFVNWSPEKIAAFFYGFTKVILVDRARAQSTEGK